MKRRTRQRWLGRSAVIGLALGIAVVVVKRDDIALTLQRATLPEAVEYHEATSDNYQPVAPGTSAPAESPTPVVPKTTQATPAARPAEMNLKVPFTPQAPHANWQAPYQEFCEEAAVFMAASYLQNEAIPSADFADQKMLAIKAFEEDRFGYYVDTTAAETAVILREYYDIKEVKLLENPTAEDLRASVAAGKLVIVPAAGRLLGNPYFTPPGPLYHMLVIKGYTADGRLIVNDPGTRRGADYVYDAAVIMNAMHDWRTDGNIELGRKVVIVVG